MPERIRLHISPLTPDLLPTILPPSILPTASNLSYHSLQTFPERNYGYVELPAMEAAKIKKKLNGSILKGSKMKIEEARPEKKMKRSAEEEDKEEVDTERRARRVSKKQKREEGVLPGFELPKERKVKRGWTEPAVVMKSGKGKEAVKGTKQNKSKKPKATISQFSNEPELLFRTKVPLNAANVAKTGKGEKKAGKSGKSKSSREVVLHEFSNTTKHASFLRENQASNGKKTTSDFVEGKGWVDEDGNVIEALPKEKKPPRKQVQQVEKATKTASRDHASAPVDSDETSSSGSSSSSEDDSEENDAEDAAIPPMLANATSTAEANTKDLSNGTSNRESGEDSDAASSSGTSSSSDSDSDEAEDPNLPTVNVSSPQAPPTATHPLEALFKKPALASSSTPRKPNLEVKTSFSFFDPDAPDEPLNRLMPQTPFTQRDLQYRSIRSAAPTPDTAAPNKTGFGNLWGEGDDEESDEDEGEGDGVAEGTPVAGKDMVMAEAADGKEGESEFSKWFWEHRGETNRAWKKRKREAAKEKRQSSKRKGRGAA
ncbi:hypothetical protein MMC30_009241 [Trapelia coarctata]|nr:hypothetical protein [Trapelia coarctata]